MNKQTQLLLSSWKNYKTFAPLFSTRILDAALKNEKGRIYSGFHYAINIGYLLYPVFANYAHSLAAFHYSVPSGARPTFHGPWIRKRSPVELPTGARQAIGFLPISKRRSPTPSLYKPIPFLSVHQTTPI